MIIGNYCKSPYILISVFLFVLQSFFVPQTAHAVVRASDVFSSDFNNVDFIDDPLGVVYAAELGLPVGNTEKNIDLHSIIVNIIKYFLSFVGIIAVTMILAGGFKFMVAGGNADSLADARHHIINGVVGLMITITSYTIVGTVVKTVESLLSG